VRFFPARRRYLARRLGTAYPYFALLWMR
jgi:hypothetical protein